MTHEYLFLLSKSERYFYDQEAISEPMADLLAYDPDGITHAQMYDVLRDAAQHEDPSVFQAMIEIYQEALPPGEWINLARVMF